MPASPIADGVEREELGVLAELRRDVRSDAGPGCCRRRQRTLQDDAETYSSATRAASAEPSGQPHGSPSFPFPARSNRTLRGETQPCTSPASWSARTPSASLATMATAVCVAMALGSGSDARSPPSMYSITVKEYPFPHTRLVDGDQRGMGRDRRRRDPGHRPDPAAHAHGEATAGVALEDPVDRPRGPPPMVTDPRSLRCPRVCPLTGTASVAGHVHRIARRPFIG